MRYQLYLVNTTISSVVQVWILLLVRKIVLYALSQRVGLAAYVKISRVLLKRDNTLLRPGQPQTRHRPNAVRLGTTPKEASALNAKNWSAPADSRSKTQLHAVHQLTTLIAVKHVQPARVLLALGQTPCLTVTRLMHLQMDGTICVRKRTASPEA